MNEILGYFFDLKRMLVYESNTSNTEIELINKTVQPDKEESVALKQPYITNFKKRPQGIIANSRGICPTYNCNLRCSYCGCKLLC